MCAANRMNEESTAAAVHPVDSRCAINAVAFERSSHSKLLLFAEGFCVRLTKRQNFGCTEENSQEAATRVVGKLRNSLVHGLLQTTLEECGGEDRKNAVVFWGRREIGVVLFNGDAEEAEAEAESQETPQLLHEAEGGWVLRVTPAHRPNAFCVFYADRPHFDVLRVAFRRQNSEDGCEAVLHVVSQHRIPWNVDVGIALAVDCVALPNSRPQTQEEDSKLQICVGSVSHAVHLFEFSNEELLLKTKAKEAPWTRVPFAPRCIASSPNGGFVAICGVNSRLLSCADGRCVWNGEQRGEVEATAARWTREGNVLCIAHNDSSIAVVRAATSPKEALQSAAPTEWQQVASFDVASVVGAMRLVFDVESEKGNGRLQIAVASAEGSLLLVTHDPAAFEQKAALHAAPSVKAFAFDEDADGSDGVHCVDADGCVAATRQPIGQLQRYAVVSDVFDAPPPPSPIEEGLQSAAKRRVFVAADAAGAVWEIEVQKAATHRCLANVCARGNDAKVLRFVHVPSTQQVFALIVGSRHLCDVYNAATSIFFAALPTGDAVLDVVAGGCEGLYFAAGRSGCVASSNGAVFRISRHEAVTSLLCERRGTEQLLVCACRDGSVYWLRFDAASSQFHFLHRRHFGGGHQGVGAAGVEKLFFIASSSLSSVSSGSSFPLVSSVSSVPSSLSSVSS